MNAPRNHPAGQARQPTVTSLPFFEFVSLMAGSIALTALAIDLMLPALPQIGADLHVASANDRQWIITALMAGIGVGSLIYGPLSDRYGRKPVLCASIALFILANLVSMTATSFPVMIASRIAGGLFISANRVVTIGIVRDQYHGDAMARVMSLIFIVFTIVPILAPGLGQIILLFAPWQATFGLLVVLSVVVLIWVLLRLPETLSEENRIGISPRDLAAMFRTVASHRCAMGHTLAAGLMMGALTGFIVSIQQIMFDVFDAQRIFPLVFASFGLWMGAASFFNSRLVGRFGARQMSQGALIVQIALSGLHAILVWTGRETLVSFILLQGMCMGCMPFTMSNLGSIAMEPFARGAGLASSVQSFLNSMIASAIGAYIGARFNGTTIPLALGFMIAAIGALGVVIWAERGRMFRRPANLRG